MNRNLIFIVKDEKKGCGNLYFEIYFIFSKKIKGNIPKIVFKSLYI